MPRTRTLSDDAVLERATDVFWRNGYASTSLRELAEVTGLSSAALYHRFTDKSGLFEQVLRRYAQDSLGERLSRLSGLADPLAAIRAFLDELIAMSLSDPAHRGCLLINTALDGSTMGGAAPEVVRERFNAVEAFFASRLEDAVAAGMLDVNTDIAANATALLGAVFAIRVLARLDPEASRLEALAGQAMKGLPGMDHQARDHLTSADHPTGRDGEYTLRRPGKW